MSILLKKKNDNAMELTKMYNGPQLTVDEINVLGLIWAILKFSTSACPKVLESNLIFKKWLQQHNVLTFFFLVFIMCFLLYFTKHNLPPWLHRVISFFSDRFILLHFHLLYGPTSLYWWQFHLLLFSFQYRSLSFEWPVLYY